MRRSSSPPMAGPSRFASTASPSPSPHRPCRRASSSGDLGGFLGGARPPRCCGAAGDGSGTCGRPEGCSGASCGAPCGAREARQSRGQHDRQGDGGCRYNMDDLVARIRAELAAATCREAEASSGGRGAPAAPAAAPVPEPPRHAASDAATGANADLVEALAREGRRLRQALDGALAEAQAERLRGDAGMPGGADERVPPSEASPRGNAISTRLLRAEATAAALGSAQLLTELEASRDESRRLRRELEGALQAGAAAAGASSDANGGASRDATAAAAWQATAERERLARELEQALADGRAAAAAAAAATAERARAQAKSSELKAELDAATAFGRAWASPSRAAAPPPPPPPSSGGSSCGGGEDASARRAGAHEATATPRPHGASHSLAEPSTPAAPERPLRTPSSGLGGFAALRQSLGLPEEREDRAPYLRRTGSCTASTASTGCAAAAAPPSSSDGVAMGSCASGGTGARCAGAAGERMSATGGSHATGASGLGTGVGPSREPLAGGGNGRESSEDMHPAHWWSRFRESDKAARKPADVGGPSLRHSHDGVLRPRGGPAGGALGSSLHGSGAAGGGGSLSFGAGGSHSGGPCGGGGSAGPRGLGLRASDPAPQGAGSSDCAFDFKQSSCGSGIDRDGLLEREHLFERDSLFGRLPHTRPIFAGTGDTGGFEASCSRWR